MRREGWREDGKEDRKLLTLYVARLNVVAHFYAT